MGCDGPTIMPPPRAGPPPPTNGLGPPETPPGQPMLPPDGARSGFCQRRRCWLGRSGAKDGAPVGAAAASAGELDGGAAAGDGEGSELWKVIGGGAGGTCDPEFVLGFKPANMWCTGSVA